MNPNKSGRYLKYAIGEIILVVIGILIALHLNTLKENQKLKQQEIAAYCKIQEDLNSDIDNTNKTIRALNERQKTAKKLLTNLLKIQEDKGVILADYLDAIRSFKFIASKAAIMDITSSGKLENLKDQILKKAILNYYTEQDYRTTIINANVEFINQKIFDYNDFTGFGIHEMPLYKGLYDEELQLLLKSKNWQTDPDHPLFVHLKNFMNMTIILCEREKQLLTEIQQNAKQLKNLINPYCL